MPDTVKCKKKLLKKTSKNLLFCLILCKLFRLLKPLKSWSGKTGPDNNEISIELKSVCSALFPKTYDWPQNHILSTNPKYISQQLVQLKARYYCSAVLQYLLLRKIANTRFSGH